MADFTLGEAIGLRGRFTQAENLAAYQGRALARAAQEAAARRKADEELYADMEKNIRAPKDLQRLYKKPAQEFTTDFLVQLRKLKSEGRLSERGYDLVDQYRELMSEVEAGSDQMKGFYKDFKDQSTYVSKAQDDFKKLADQSETILQLGDKGKNTKIPGYDFDNYTFGEAPGQISLATFQEKIDIEDTLRDRMRELTEVIIPPTGMMAAGQEMIEYGTQTFFTRKQAQEWANANPGKEVPITVEDQVDALMENDNFVFQFADARGYTFEMGEEEKIKADLMEMAKGYAGEEIKYKNKTRDMNIYLNTEEKPTFSDIKLNGVINSVSSKREIFSMGGANLSGYDIDTDMLNYTPNSVNDQGVKVTGSMKGANLTSMVVMPTITKSGIEQPIFKGIGGMKNIDFSKVNDFKLYTVFSSPGGRRVYIPYSEIYLQLETSKLGNDQLARFNKQLQKQKKFEERIRQAHKTNNKNKNFELYQKINTYLKSRDMNSQEKLNNYLESLVK